MTADCKYAGGSYGEGLQANYGVGETVGEGVERPLGASRNSGKSN